MASLYGVEIMTYLTEVWELSFTHAAAIINVFQGAAFVLSVATQLLADAVLGNYWVVVLSHIAFTSGLALLAMSTPPVLSGATRNCKAYKAECVGPVQKILFYIALALIALGLSCHIAEEILTNFFEEQDSDKEDEGSLETWCCITIVAVVIPLTGFIAIDIINPWSVKFGIPAIGTAIGTLIFLIMTRSFKANGPRGSPLASAFKVFTASVTKIFHKPVDPSQLYRGEDGPSRNSDEHFDLLRCLDKAAIIIPNQSLEQQRWRLCAVSQVEQTKVLLFLTPLCMTLFIPGLVSSIGSTYFIAQANQMSRKIGHVTVPTLLLPVVAAVAKTPAFQKLFCAEPFPPLGIANSMILAVLSCIIAAKIEHRRLGMAIEHHLIGSNDSVSMTMFWLLPQFIFLTGADEISTNSLGIDHSKIRDQNVTKILRQCIQNAKAVFGAGTLSGVLAPHVVNKLSGRGGKLSWFQSTLNRSRLDKYYWALSGISAVNFVVYLLMVLVYFILLDKLFNGPEEKRQDHQLSLYELKCDVAQGFR